MKQDPYTVVHSLYSTEKTQVLSELKDNKSNPSIAAFERPKAVFIVEKKANKRQIADAIEQIYAAKKIKVKSVNTINVKPKQKRVRGRLGFEAGYKKAIVTLEKGDDLGESV